uniref:Uncharacterized protein n=1 Tax=Tetraselmis sp. GSL018 TaxID=582737 RepID=A0A061SEF0_9CHLO
MQTVLQRRPSEGTQGNPQRLPGGVSKNAAPDHRLAPGRFHHPGARAQAIASKSVAAGVPPGPQAANEAARRCLDSARKLPPRTPHLRSHPRRRPIGSDSGGSPNSEMHVLCGSAARASSAAASLPSPTRPIPRRQSRGGASESPSASASAPVLSPQREDERQPAPGAAPLGGSPRLVDVARELGLQPIRTWAVELNLAASDLEIRLGDRLQPREADVDLQVREGGIDEGRLLLQSEGRRLFLRVVARAWGARAWRTWASAVP